MKKFEHYQNGVHNTVNILPAKTYDKSMKKFEHYQNGVHNTVNIGYNTNVANDEGDNEKETRRLLQIESWITNRVDMRFNTVSGFIEFADRRKNAKRYERLDDSALVTFRRNLRLAKFKCAKADLYDILAGLAHANKYNPIRDYFDGLPTWDGEDYIAAVAERVPVLAEQRQMWHLFFRRWVIAFVGTALGQCTNHTCLVLVGAQGKRKTTFFRSLVPEALHDYYYEGSLSGTDKDVDATIAENIIINLDELESAMRAEIGHLKSLITRDNVKIRRPYAPLPTVLPRLASFVGSVNHADFLKDVTGSRRFLCVDVVDTINVDISQDLLAMMYSQALYLFNTGERYWFDSDEVLAINEHNEQYAEVSVEREALFQHFAPCERDDSNAMFLTTTQIKQKLEELSVNSNGLGGLKINEKKLGQELRLHFTRVSRKVNRKTFYAYIVQRNTDWNFGKGSN